MNDALTIEDHIESGYSELSAKLRSAADFIVRNPVDFATRSLRSVAGQTDLAPATFTRLSRALGFSSYEDMREVARNGLSRAPIPYSERASLLQSEATGKNGAQKPFFYRQTEACIGNIDQMMQTIDPKLLETVVDRLSKSKRVGVVGALGSAPFADYFSHLANWFADDWSVANKADLSQGATLSKTDEASAFIVISKRPYVQQSLKTAALAAENGAFIAIITDSLDCPALKYSDAGFILSSESPQFFPSYAATLVLIESLIGMLVARAGPRATKSIANVEIYNRRIEEFRVS